MMIDVHIIDDYGFTVFSATEKKTWINVYIPRTTMTQVCINWVTSIKNGMLTDRPKT